MKHKITMPKLINLWGFISNFTIFEFKLQTAEKFFVFEILGIGDDAMVHTSLFRINIDWDDELEICFNAFYLLHLNYKRIEVPLLVKKFHGDTLQECWTEYHEFFKNKKHLIRTFDKIGQARNGKYEVIVGYKND
jgi:hypothetical protein